MNKHYGDTPGAALPGSTQTTSSGGDHRYPPGLPPHCSEDGMQPPSPPFAFFSAKSIGMSTCAGRKPSSLRTALRHNRREIQAELGAFGHIDPTRARFNVVLCGPGDSAQVEAMARKRMEDAQVVKKRRDAVQAIELLMSLPADTNLNPAIYFPACLAWAEKRFGVKNVFAADTHLDEAAPHCHILILPLEGDVYAGSKMLAKRKLMDMRSSFNKDVAGAFGLQLPSAAPRGSNKVAMAEMVLEELDRTDDPVCRSVMWPAVQQCVMQAPQSFHHLLGLRLTAVPRKRLRSMAQIFTAAGKGPRKDPDEWKRNQNIQCLPCVGIDSPRSIGNVPPADVDSDATTPRPTEGGQHAQ